MSSPGKKRKRVDDSNLAESSEKYKVVLSSKEPHEFGPIIANFTSADPPPQTPFTCYYVNKDSANRSESVDFAAQNMIVAGESKEVEFVTAQRVRSDGGSRYLIGLKSKSSKTITIRECPLHLISRDVKRLKDLAPIQSAAPGEERMLQRAKLGETFGTKKAQKAIRAAERNRVDVGAMEGVLDIIGEGVEGRVVGLPSNDKAKEIMDESRPIPSFDLTATKLEDVYPLMGIIPDPELGAIRIKPFLAAENGNAIRLLPYARSGYINARVQALEKGDKKRLRLLFFLATLFAFRSLDRKKLSDKAAVSEKLHSVPQIIIDRLMSKFTESARDSTKVQITSDKETLMLTTMFALTLHIDNFVVDSSIIAKDLSISVAKVNLLYKALGCKIEVPNTSDCARLGVGQAVLGNEKKAILRVPLVFPQGRSGKKRR